MYYKDERLENKIMILLTPYCDCQLTSFVIEAKHFEI